jgi:subtilisin-like proprotein convertase family protein
MVAVNYNFDIEKGSDFEISFVYNDSNGNPVDLSNQCVILTLVPIDISTSLTSEDLSIRGYSNTNNSPFNEYSLTANNLGFINLKLSAKETYSFNFLSAVYDLDIRDISGSSNTRIAAGSINILLRNSDININNLGNFTCEIPQIQQTPIPDDTPGQPGQTPTATPVPTDFDFCLPYDCGPLDLFSTVYNGSGLALEDLSTVSGNVIVTNTGIITNVELAINKLNHNNPSDLVFLLSPPSGDKILLSANSKISNFNNNFSFMFSNKADNDKFLYNINNGQTCNIFDKTNIFNYNNENLLSTFSGLFGSSVTGVWDFIVLDTDPLGSGFIDSWKLIVTYQNNIPENTSPFECGIT